MVRLIKSCVPLFSVFVLGCASTSNIGMLSNGDLEGANLYKAKGNGLVVGESCGPTHSLANAVENALNETPYDTIINAQVTSKTGIFVFQNCIQVKGEGLDSKNLKKESGDV